jgi:Domain of unknown function (DUF5606)
MERMTLDKILAISGRPGLYELKTRTRTGFVAVSLLDGKQITVVNARNTVSLLSEVAVYTLKEEILLRDVFQKIKTKENGGKTAVSSKDDNLKIEAYFSEILPDYDEEKVFISHIKKIIQWYNILQDKDISFEAEAKKEEGEN